MGNCISAACEERPADDDLRPIRGLVIGLLLSVPLCAVIGDLTYCTRSHAESAQAHADHGIGAFVATRRGVAPVHNERRSS